MLQYITASGPILSLPASSRAFSSAWRQRHASNPWPPFAGPLQRAQPPLLQFTVPRGVPLYPVLMMRFARTRTAPTRRFMQFERCDARDARVWVSVCAIAYHKVHVPSWAQSFFVQEIQVVEVGHQSSSGVVDTDVRARQDPREVRVRGVEKRVVLVNKRVEGQIPGVRGRREEATHGSRRR